MALITTRNASKIEDDLRSTTNMESLLNLISPLSNDPTGVWRQWAVRVRIGALVAAIISLCLMACGSIAPDSGITAVGIDQNGELVAQRISESIFVTTRFLVRGDEANWSFGGRSEPELPVDWGTASVITPRGGYEVVGSEIIHRDGGNSKVEYSPGMPYKGSFVFFHHEATDLRVATDGERNPFDLQPSIVYDEPTKTVIVAHGVQGVLLGTSDGNWQKLGVDRLVPISIDRAEMTRIMLREIIWLSISLAVCLTAFVAVFAALQHHVNQISATIAFTLCLAVIASASIVGFAPINNSLLAGFLFVGFHLLAFFAGLIALVSIDTESKTMQIVSWGSLAAFTIGICLIYVGWVFVGPTGEVDISVNELAWLLAIPLAGAVLTLVIVQPTTTQLVAFGFTAVLMTGLFVYPFFWWTNESLGILSAKIIGLCLVTVIAIVLFVTTKRRREADQKCDAHTNQRQE